MTPPPGHVGGRLSSDLEMTWILPPIKEPFMWQLSWLAWHSAHFEIPRLIQRQQQFWKVLFYSPTTAQQCAGMSSCPYFCREDRWAHVVSAQTNGFHWPPQIKIDPLIQTSFNKAHFGYVRLSATPMRNSQCQLKADRHSWRLKASYTQI